MNPQDEKHDPMDDYLEALSVNREIEFVYKKAARGCLRVPRAVRYWPPVARVAGYALRNLAGRALRVAGC